MSQAGTGRITLGGGCFWCTEAVFARVRGVRAVEPGYCNGQVSDPTYEQVCTGQTGHAEVVRIDYDPAQVTLRQLLEVFFCIHDATSLNRQGADVGTQYRSGIYFEHPEDEAVAKAFLADANAALDGRVVTELQPLRLYSAAEPYHHHYFARNPDQGYCVFVVAGKVDKFRKTFSHLVQDDAGSR